MPKKLPMVIYRIQTIPGYCNECGNFKGLPATTIDLFYDLSCSM